MWPDWSGSIVIYFKYDSIIYFKYAALEIFFYEQTAIAFQLHDIYQMTLWQSLYFEYTMTLISVQSSH